METVAVHGGAFHADDVFAVAILKSIYPDLRVVRTRDPKKLRGADARVDVGNKYNHKTKDYDHHQREMAGKRDNGIPYSGVGLIWKHYGRNLVEEDVWRNVDKRLIQNIDAEDNGVRTYIVQGIFPYFIDEMIKSFNPQWPDITMENFDESFGEAVEIAIKVLKAEIERAKSVLKAKKIFLDAVSKSESKDYVILDEYIPNGEVAVEETDLKYVVFRDTVENYWLIKAVPKSLLKRGNRKDLPKGWGGLIGEELEKVSDVKGAMFCHWALFLAGAETKEAILEMLEKALKD